MKTLGGPIVAVLALAATSCVPTITITTKTNGDFKATVKPDKMKVSPDVPFVLWQVKNKTNQDVKVTVENFYLGDTKKEPLLCQGQPVKTAKYSEGFLACVVVHEYRDDNPYCYDVYVNDKPVTDPQIIIKRDKGGRYDFLTACPVRAAR